MATKPLKTLTFEGLSDTYTVPQIDDTLSVTGEAADAKATGDSLSEKADKNGTIATAERLTGGQALLSDSEPYHFRKAPDLTGSKDEVIVGASVGWNQLTKVTTNQTITNHGITFVFSTDGTITLNGTASENTYSNQNTGRDGVPVPSGHKVFISGCPSGGSSSTYYGKDGYNASMSRIDTGNGNIVEVGNQSLYQIMIASGATCNNVVFKPQFVDLTLCFGTTIADYVYSLEQATAGSGVAWLKKYFPKMFGGEYHAYDAGSIQSVSGLSEHKMVGFNQFDKSTVITGKFINGAGVETNNANLAHSDYIPCFPSTSYYTTLAKTSGVWRYLFYDRKKELIPTSLYTDTNALFTTPANCHYFIMNMKVSEIDTVCTNLSVDGTRNGEYEPYTPHSYPLDSSVTLRGMLKLDSGNKPYADGDLYESDGTVTRKYAVRVLNGTETWSGSAANGYYIPLHSLKKIKSADGYDGHMIADKLPIGAWSEADTLQGYYDSSDSYPNQNWLYYRTQSLSSVAEVKSFFASNPVTVVYELATPTTETAQPFQSPMLVGATEEYVSDSVVPVGHESRYYEDVAKKVYGLPSDFSTLIAPVEVAYKATRNYAVGNYLIVKNQLYKVTSAISNNGTITPGSNVTATTIMAEILALA